MKIEPECIPCNINFGIRILRRLGNVELRRIVKIVEKFIDKDVTPADVGTALWKDLTKDVKDKDLFKTEKRIANESVKALLKRMNVEKMSIRDAIKLAVVGNAFDVVPSTHFTSMKINKLIKQKLAIDDRRLLESFLKKTNAILYLGDNAGEIGLDYILVKKLRKMGIKIFFTVKKEPLVNDATIKDANYFDLEKIATLLPLPPKFGVRKSDIPKKVLTKVDMIISKGQANYETVSEDSWGVPIAYLLKAKCVVIARNFKVPVGSNICKVVF